MTDELVIGIETDRDVVRARQAGRALAATLGFSNGDQSVIAAAISEVTRNILVYARRGEVRLRRLGRPDRAGLSIIARDQGPGIADVARALQDGYSTSGGLGLGLSGARRLMDEFDIISAPGTGTTVTMKKWRGGQYVRPRLRPRPRLLDWGVAARSLPDEHRSGDGHLVQPLERGALVGVVDALGHGDEAADVSHAAVTTLREFAHEPVGALLQRVHRELRGTRGAVVSLASFDWIQNEVTWAGVGNVAGVVHLAEPSTPREQVPLVNRAGIVGVELPAVRPWVVPMTPGDTIVVATDGVDAGFTDAGEVDGPPTAVAQAILDHYARRSDDALVLVARYPGPPHA